MQQENFENINSVNNKILPPEKFENGIFDNDTLIQQIQEKRKNLFLNKENYQIK